MTLTILPIYRPEPLLFDYDESRIEEYLHLYYELLGPVLARGVQADEVPASFFEAYVFLNFFYGATAQFTASGSLFCANWRWMPAAERMARKIGATALADQLDETWEEVKLIPSAILDAFDRGSLEWKRTPPAEGENVPIHHHVNTYASKSLGDQVSYLLQQKWIDTDIDSLPLEPIVEVSPYAEYRLQAQIAAYLSSSELPYEVFDDLKKFNARIAEFLDVCDDFEVRRADAPGPNPFKEVWEELRENPDKFVRRNGKKCSDIYSFKSTRSNFRTVAMDGFLLSEVWTSCGPLLVAYYKDAVQIVDPETHAELAISSLPEPFALRSKATECAFRSIRPVIPTTSGHLNRGIRPLWRRCLEA